MDSTLSNIISSLMEGKYVDPLRAESMGVKNIHFYRTKFYQICTQTSTTPETMKILMQLFMNVKNRKRVMSGLALDPDLMADPQMKEVVSFIDKYTSQGTQDQTLTKMPVVKIPDSFPDICACLFVTTSLLKGMTDSSAIVDAMIKKSWASSLAFDDDIQGVNEVAVEAMWNSWAKTPGKTKNFEGKELKFDEEIYKNSANDKILLFNPNGTTVAIPSNETGYDRAILITWVETWKGATKGKSITLAGGTTTKAISN
jgi:hypothetical protein